MDQYVFALALVAMFFISVLALALFSPVGDRVLADLYEFLKEIMYIVWLRRKKKQY